jgi:subtilisin family serine protease
VFHRRHNPRAWFSNYGTRITVSAPGYFPSDVTCFVDPLDPTRKYRPGFGGTSGAAPKVAGVCALMLSANPSLTPRDVKQLLVRTGSEVLTSPDRPGGVFVNARKAVKKALGGC